MLTRQDDDQQHHEEGFPDFVQVIIEMGNPFTNTTPELLALDTRDVIDNSGVNTVRTV